VLQLRIWQSHASAFRTCRSPSAKSQANGLQENQRRFLTPKSDSVHSGCSVVRYACLCSLESDAEPDAVFSDSRLDGGVVEVKRCREPSEAAEIGGASLSSAQYWNASTTQWSKPVPSWMECSNSDDSSGCADSMQCNNYVEQVRTGSPGTQDSRGF
jgi:hypothetical protein